MKKFNFKTLLLAIGLVVASQNANAWWYINGDISGSWTIDDSKGQMNSNNEITFSAKTPGTYYFRLYKTDATAASGANQIKSTEGDIETGVNNEGAMWVKFDITMDVYFKVTHEDNWEIKIVGTPSMKFKYAWSCNIDWAWCGDMTYNSGDQTYSVISPDGYCATASGFNWSYTKAGDAPYSDVIETNGSPATGNKCMFTLVPNGSNAYKLKISKCKSVGKTSHVYFDNSQAQWNTTVIQLVVGNDIESKTFTMTKLGTSNMYYTAIDVDWTDVTYYALIGNGTSWDSGKWSSSNISNATKKSAIYYGDYNLSNSITTLITLPSGDNKNMTLTYQADGYGALNKAQTVSIMTSSNGGTSYSASASWLGTLQASRYTLSNNGTGSTTTKTLSSSDTYASGMQTSSITFTEKATNTGYTFTGFNSTNSQPSSTSYTYTVDGAKTIYAFYKLTDYTYTYSTTPQNCSYTPAGTAHYNDNVQLTITPNDGYVVTSVTSPQTTINRSEDVYSFNMPASDVSITVVTSLSKVQVTSGVHSSGNGQLTVSPEPDANGKVDAGANVTFTADPDDGYHLEGWYSDAACETPIAGASASSLTYTIPTISAAASVYVKFAANTYSVKFNGNGNTSGSMSNQSFTYDEAAKALTTNAFQKTGYTFQGWDTDQSADEVVYTDGQSVSNLTTVNGGTVNLYAVWQINTYALTLPDTTTEGGTRVCNFKIDSVKPAPVEGKYNYNTPIQVYLSPKDGYRLAVTATYNDGSSHELSLTHDDFSFLYTFNMPAGDATISVEPKEYKLEGNFSNGGGTADFDGTKHTFDGVNHSFTLSLEGGKSYKFKVYNEAYSGTSTYGSDYFMGFSSDKDIKSTTAGYEVACDGAACFVLHAGIGGNYTFSIGTSENNKPLMNVQYPDESYIEYNNTQYHFSQYGQTDKFITDGIPFPAINTQYTDMIFVWKGTRYEAQNVMNGDESAHTNIKYYIWTSSSVGKGVSIHTAEQAKAGDNYYFIWDPKNEQLTAVYPSYIAGTWTSWAFTQQLDFVDDIATYTHKFTAEEKTKGIQFKIVYEGKWYSVSGGYTFTENGSTTLVQNSNENENLKITPNQLDDEYTFTFNKTNKELTVYYPEANKFKVQVSENGTDFVEKEIGSTSGIMIHAASKSGYRFTGWETTGDIVLANKTAQTTNVKANSVGTVKATYTNEGFVYFRDPNKSSWGKAHAYFYSGSYWDNNKGSGSKNIQHGPYGMAKLEGSDNNNPIYYFDYQSNFIDWNSHIISFTNNYCQGADNFNMVQAAYRGDFNSSLPMYVPRNFKTHYLNSSEYYNEGIWMKFNDKESGYDLRGDFNNWVSDVNKFITSEANINNFNFYTTVYLEAGKTYNFLIYNKNNTQYGCPYQTIKTKTDGEHGWKFYEGQGDCQIVANVSGDYTFHINLQSGEVILYVTYPMEAGDYRVKYGEGAAVKYSNIIKSGNASGPISLWLPNGTTTLNFEKVTSITGEGVITWDSEKTVEVTTTAAGVYQMTLTSAGTISDVTAYTGDYFVRTDCADGGWKDYLTTPDNKMHFTDRQQNYETDQTTGYNYYYTKFFDKADGNVRFVIANTINSNLSGIMKGDAVIGVDKEVLPGQAANVRFAWNSNTNAMSRAYISGSTDVSKRYLVLNGNTDGSGNSLMLNENGAAFPEGGEGRTNLHADEEIFKDKGNWVYQIEIKAKPGCAVKLMADYSGKTQYFIGAVGEETGSRKKIMDGTTEAAYRMRVVYDFKTDILVAGWIPDDASISGSIVLGGDMLLVRQQQGQASQITFGDATAQVSSIKQIYGVLELNKEDMTNRTDGSGKRIPLTSTSYDRCMYWISFPFRVQLSKVFGGVGGYGTKWIMQKYRGDRRAQEGLFKNANFWEYMGENEYMEPYVGYVLSLNPTYFDEEDDEVWQNVGENVAFYFPSESGEIGIIHKSSFPQSVPDHPCGIDVTLDADDTHRGLNHKNTDSHWNLIGVPAFQNKTMALSNEEVDTDLKAIYEWNPTNNSYNVKALQTSFEFRTMYAYMVQYTGTITWSDVSVILAAAPKYAYADDKNYRIELFFNGNGAEDHTYINLADGASTDFVLNEDMMKIDNAGVPNIYSFAGAYNVAYNETTFDNQSVMLGVSAPKNGSYTFAMPKDFSGKAVLVDLESGEATDLNLSNYTVELNKGTYNNRFQLLLEVEAKIPTAVDNANGEWSVDGKTKKLLINDQIYLINGGRVYNATGTMVK